MSDKSKKKKKKDKDDYIPQELKDAAWNFIQDINAEIDIYKKIKVLGALEPNPQADSFVVWWGFERYCNYYHALILFYENYDEIINILGDNDMMDGFEKQQNKMVLFYRLAKQNGLISE